MIQEMLSGYQSAVAAQEGPLTAAQSYMTNTHSEHEPEAATASSSAETLDTTNTWAAGVLAGRPNAMDGFKFDPSGLMLPANSMNKTQTQLEIDSYDIPCIPCC